LSRIKTSNGRRVRRISPVGKEKVYGGNDLPKSQVLSVKSDFKGNWGGKTKPDVGLYDPDKISGGRTLREVIIVRLTLAQLIICAKVNLTLILIDRR